MRGQGLSLAYMVVVSVGLLLFSGVAGAGDCDQAKVEYVVAVSAVCSNSGSPGTT